MKKGFTLVELVGVVIILGIIVLLAFPPLLSMIRDANGEITKANETLLLTAADQYVDSYKNNFPKTDGNVYCVSYGDLIKDEKIPSNIPNKDGKTLDYNTLIKVTVNNGKYEYALDNSCERNIKITSLVELLKQQYKDDNTSGLLKDEDGSYYYKGTNEQVSNNYVWFGGHLWRVVSINNDNTITMITQQPVVAIQPSTSKVWTTEQEYKDSYVNHWLNDVFLKSMEEPAKSKIQDNIFNVGIYDNVTEIQTTSKVGLLDENQYTRVGKTNSFLDIKESFWFGNRINESRILIDGGSSMPLLPNNIRPVIKISDIIVADGDGTLSDPYREKTTTTGTNNIKVGEYIYVATSGTDCGEDKKCLFRVVSKNNDSIKVILNGLLPEESAFGSTTTYTKENTVDTVLTIFANTIDSTYRYTGKKVFNIGPYGDGANYTTVQDITIEGNVGLPVIGEIFTGNDIDISTSNLKTFVNANTIENPTISDYFWTMNAFTNVVVRAVRGDTGFMDFASPTSAVGVRPVLFLNNNLSFTGGEGTAENPFTLD